jgi:predicted SAM-dependent methyltransferase
MLLDPRADFIRNGISKEQKGIEIAPWFRPLAPKREGYCCKVLDIFTKEELLERAVNDKNIPTETHLHIEEVDFVGSASEIEEIIPENQHGYFDYIISSHNFEHLPNPIKFLQGCEKILKPSGTLIMAVPDQRACFDYFRPHTTIAEWIESYISGRSQPNKKQIFEMEAYYSEYCNGRERRGAFSLHNDRSKIICTGDILEAYQKWNLSHSDDFYTDAHCSVFTPASFELLILECNILGFTNLFLKKQSETHDCEFIVILVCRKNLINKVDKIQKEVQRSRLMHQVLNEKAEASLFGSSTQGRILFYLKKILDLIRKRIMTILIGSNGTSFRRWILK